MCRIDPFDLTSHYYTSIADANTRFRNFDYILNLIRYRGNEDIKRFVELGKEKNPRYIISLCQRVMSCAKTMPEDLIMDAVRHVTAKERFTVREFMSYLEYRGFGNLVSKFRDRDREHYIIRAKEIAEELADE